MKKYKASCEDDQWSSKIVEADSIDEAADIVAAELVAHVKEAHSMDLPKDPDELHKAVVDHVVEVQ